MSRELWCCLSRLWSIPSHPIPLRSIPFHPPFCMLSFFLCQFKVRECGVSWIASHQHRGKKWKSPPAAAPAARELEQGKRGSPPRCEWWMVDGGCVEGGAAMCFSWLLETTILAPAVRGVPLQQRTLTRPRPIRGSLPRPKASISPSQHPHTATYMCHTIPSQPLPASYQTMAASSRGPSPHWQRRRPEKGD